MINELLQIDNMEYMKDIPDNHFDLAIVDPPYGKRPLRKDNGTYGISGLRKFDSKDDSWDVKPSEDYFKNLFRISKNQIIWGANYFIESLKSSNCFIVWNKKTGKNVFADFELAFTSFTSTTKLFTLEWRGFARGEKGNLIHPTQKPIALYRWLLTNYAKPGYKLFDSHSGSGSFRIAAYDMGFDLVSCELDADYCKDNETRYQKHIKQTGMFSKETINKSIYKNTSWVK